LQSEANECVGALAGNQSAIDAKIMFADKGFDGDEVRSGLLMKSTGPVIPPKANRKNPLVCDYKADCPASAFTRQIVVNEK